MRRFAVSFAAVMLTLATPAATPAVAQGANLPPHAWLFGTWTGGIFPAPSGLSDQACLSQPIVIFTRDLVLRATITDQTLTQREIETARTSPQGAEFRFTAASGGSGLLGTGAGPEVGFGCASPDELHVQRRGENEIVFPGCADFPNSLVRCHMR